ncbi:uncharacterized protein [Parasteatoda tepidariorum]|uniref:uncharacterized protein n=1 Tax=Parasteatoda tepidariorum TaxID=114398 RepID=UPI00077FDA28|nr:uncharacterized protein LOC107445208 [Parasteatoda tepidariorum]XP_015915040.1 uncharacterized protein LOC107445208 [Parasteatoda tepidariorum]XP_015915041.1 uncharacterized protein LOC107445208 [Parasteatoda tepidariorum]XP_015915042.1 uncharacterized protein LOC107445208 [Parasteatoda tepidariorum]
MMLKVFIFLIFGTISCSALHLNITDVGEYGRQNVWRKTLCEKHSDVLYSDMEKCLQLEPKALLGALDECFTEVVPQAKTVIAAYVTAACEKKELFLKVDSCMEEYEANVGLKKQMEMGKEAEDCYFVAAKKHNLPELFFYFESAPKS